MAGNSRGKVATDREEFEFNTCYKSEALISKWVEHLIISTPIERQTLKIITSFMSVITVPYLVHQGTDPALPFLSLKLNELDRHSIQITPWPDFPYKPNVSFVVAHNKKNIFLKYFVQEKAIRGLYSATNNPVFRDSCVEFFISFEKEEYYYNLEFNCIGTCLFGYGKEKQHRELIGQEQISKIRRWVSIEHLVKNSFYPISWELTVVIPVEVFIYHQIKNLSGTKSKVNFYKCGDESEEPHFLAWSNIVSNSPNFHLPHYFGNMHFA